jgi:ATP-binding cassette subfamily F protein 3
MSRAAAAPGEAPKPVARIVRRKTTAELRELRRRVEEIERKIEGLERRIEEIGRALSDPRLYANGDRVRAITLERNEAVQELSGLMREWEQLSTALAGDA